jgi:hypothetical protein
MQTTRAHRRGLGERTVAVGPWSTDALTAALLVLRVVVLLTVIADVPHFPSSAADRFHDIAHAAGTPYRDVAVEYPIGELALIELVGGWSAGVARALLAVVAFGADLLAFACVLAGWGRDASRRYLLAGAPLLIFLYRRSDLVAVALAVAGVVLIRREAERRGGVLLGLAVLSKLWPAVLLPMLLLARRTRALWAAIVTIAAGVAGWLALGGPDGVRQVVSLRGASGWELESTVGAVVWPLTGEYRYEQGANRTGEIPGWARICLAVLLVLGLAIVWWRGRHAQVDPAGGPALAAVATLLVLSPVFSPQYVAWLLPWAAIASLDSRRLFRLAVVPCVITGAILTVWYLDVAIGRPANQAVMILRNASVVLIPLAWLVGDRFGGRPRAAGPADGV